MALLSASDGRVRKEVLPVAGRGTRLVPATRSAPKELLPVVDRPLLEYAVEEALAASLDQIIFVTAKNKDAIEDHFDGWTGANGARPTFATVRQASPKGPGDAILQTEEIVDRATGEAHRLWNARGLSARAVRSRCAGPGRTRSPRPARARQARVAAPLRPAGASATTIGSIRPGED